jgi:hypothetical protein
MLVKGHSGFGIELLDELTIRKSATGAGAGRLKLQIEKQVCFQKNSLQDKVRTPKIFRTADAPGRFHADMEFIAAKDFIQFLSEADRAALDDFLKTITDFIRRNLKLCENVDVSEQVELKLFELKKKNVPAIYIKAAKKLCVPPVRVPVGPCHGDLTLSNILFKGDHLYLLDFLDCFVESPLQDIVKLRQDTRFGWSLQLYQADFNWPKIQITLRYLDQKIEAAFRDDEWFCRHYKLFQLVNLMRVLPYCTETKTAALITSSLDQMLKKSVA